MPSLPIPMVGSLFLGFMLISVALRRDRSWLFVALLASCALQGVVISLNQHYGLTGFMLVQPVTATLIPPLAWITLQGSAVRSLSVSRDLPHLIGPLFTLFCVLNAREFLGLWIPALFAGYGIAMLVLLSNEPDSLPQIRLENGEMSKRVWQVIAASLLVSAFSDGVIVAAQIIGFAAWQPWIVSVFSTFNLLVIGGLSLSDSLSRSAAGEGETGPSIMEKTGVDPAQDQQIMAKLDDLVVGQQLFLDPDLTLGQLSRKLAVPVKQLSGAINRSTRENVSRYINKRRIEAACIALKTGESVTATMFSSGFNTKSNFNREFLRIMGLAPKEWLAQEKLDRPNPAPEA